MNRPGDNDTIRSVADAAGKGFLAGFWAAGLEYAGQFLGNGFTPSQADAYLSGLYPAYTPAPEHMSGLVSLLEHAAHIGEIALVTGPYLALANAGCRLGGLAISERARGRPAAAMARRLGGIACFAAAGAVEAAALIAARPNYGPTHNILVGLVLPSVTAIVGGAVNGAREMFALTRAGVADQD